MQGFIPGPSELLGSAPCHTSQVSSLTCRRPDGSRAAVPGSGGKKQSQQNKILLEPPSCWHRASPVSSQVCYSPTPTRELLLGASPARGALERGGSAERGLPKEEQSSCSPSGVPRACTGQKRGRTWAQLPGMLSIQLLAAQPCNPPAFKEF